MALHGAVAPRIHHLDCATLCPASAAIVNDHGAILERGHMVCHCLLVEGDDGLVLVDTGLGTEDVASPELRLGQVFTTLVAPRRRVEETALHQVRALGFSPGDVRHVVPTHLDLDHAGGLPDFPGAEVHVFAPEHAAALSPPTFMERERYRAVHFRHGPRWVVHEDTDGEKWFGFSRVQALAGSPEVLLVPLVGHTRGHVGVAVRTQAGWLLHAGDAYFSHREMNARPSCPPGLAFFQRLVAVDDAARRENQARLRQLVQRERDVVVCSAHCPVELDALRRGATPERVLS
jgi:glyoxylase-like metal-dependent hydrolase (beta-lactamase superfamily II)